MSGIPIRSKCSVAFNWGWTRSVYCELEIGHNGPHKSTHPAFAQWEDEPPNGWAEAIYEDGDLIYVCPLCTWSGYPEIPEGGWCPTECIPCPACNPYALA